VQSRLRSRLDEAAKPAQNAPIAPLTLPAARHHANACASSIEFMQAVCRLRRSILHTKP
jgi:hypothetical protein